MIVLTFLIHLIVQCAYPEKYTPLRVQKQGYPEPLHTIAVLIITASHQTFSGQFWCLSGQNKFDLTHLLYIINGKVSVFLEDKVMSGQISTLIISTAIVHLLCNMHKTNFSRVELKVYSCLMIA